MSPINVLMMAYKSWPLIKPALEGVLGADHIVVVQGSWRNNQPQVARPGYLDDGTNDYLRKQERITGKMYNLYWRNFSVEQFVNRYSPGPKHLGYILNAENHPYLDPSANQQMLMMLHHGLHRVKLVCKHREIQDPGWLWIVSSDEVYDPRVIEVVRDFLEVVGDDYDYFELMADTFYFGYKWCKKEWFKRILRIRPGCFVSDDCSLECEDYEYKRFMQIPPELGKFCHYSWVRSDDNSLARKLGIWKEAIGNRWILKHGLTAIGEKEYNNESVHLLEGLHPLYDKYVLEEFDGEHPPQMSKLIQLWEIEQDANRRRRG